MKKLFSILAGLVALVMPAAVYGLQFSRTEETLINFLRSRADAQSLQKYLNGDLRFLDVSLYRAVLIDGFQGIQKVWDSTVAKAVGVCNVDRAKLDKDVHVCIDTILIGYANSGGASTDPTTISNWSHKSNTWLAGLVNAEIQILQDGNVLTSEIPARLCGSMADSTFGTGRAEGYILKNPVVLEGDKTFEVRVNFPQAIAAANTDFMRIDLIGVSTRKRGQL